MALRITGLGEEIAAVTGLPWQTSLENWPEDPLLTEKRGISRHIVRLVRASDDPDAEVYAIKETVAEFANREYKILRQLKQLGAPSVDPIAVVEGRTDSKGEELPCALATRFLPYSLPYRVLLSGNVSAHDITTMTIGLERTKVRCSHGSKPCKRNLFSKRCRKSVCLLITYGNTDLIIHALYCHFLS